MDAKVQKAMVPVREEGVGRKGGAPETTARESDPVQYLIQKAKDAAKADEELSQADKNLAGLIFAQALGRELTDDDNEE
jgi:hypothetical protein